MLKTYNAKTIKRCRFENAKKQSSLTLSEIFSIELKFTTDLLVKWFKQEHKSKFLETDALTKEKYKKLIKINTLKTTCCIATLD